MRREELIEDLDSGEELPTFRASEMLDYLGRREVPTITDAVEIVRLAGNRSRNYGETFILKDPIRPELGMIRGFHLHLSILGHKLVWWQSFEDTGNLEPVAGCLNGRTVLTEPKPRYWAFDHRLRPYALEVKVRCPSWKVADDRKGRLLGAAVYDAVLSRRTRMEQEWQDSSGVSLYHLACAVADLTPASAYEQPAILRLNPVLEHPGYNLKVTLEFYEVGWRFVGRAFPAGRLTGKEEGRVVVDRWFGRQFTTGRLNPFDAVPPGPADPSSSSSSPLNGPADLENPETSTLLFSLSSDNLRKIKNPAATVEALSKRITGEWKGVWYYKAETFNDRRNLYVPTLEGARHSIPSWENCGLRTILGYAAAVYFKPVSKWRVPWMPRRSWEDSPGDYPDPAVDATHKIGGILSIWLFRHSSERPSDEETWSEGFLNSPPGGGGKTYPLIRKKDWRCRKSIGRRRNGLLGYAQGGEHSPNPEPDCHYSEMYCEPERWRWMLTSRKRFGKKYVAGELYEDLAPGREIYLKAPAQYSQPECLMYGGKWYDEYGNDLPLPDVETIFMELEIGRNGRAMENNALDLHSRILRKVKEYELGKARERTHAAIGMRNARESKEGFC